jgi:hypothetical protein
VEILHRIRKLWLDRIRASKTHKWNEFGVYAHECMEYYSGSSRMHERFADSVGRSVLLQELPWNGMRINKSAEMVDVYLPYLYHKNPHRTVTPRRIDIPDELHVALAMKNPQFAQFANVLSEQAAQQGIQFDPMLLLQVDSNRPEREMVSALIEHVLNYTPNELNLKREARRGLVEALVKGRGLMVTEVHETPLGRLVGSTYESIDNLYLDDNFGRVEHCGWASIECRMPTFKFSRQYGIPMEKLRHQGDSVPPGSVETDYNRDERFSSQMTVYHKVFSRQGAGQNLIGENDEDEDLRRILDPLGDHVFLILTEDYEFPVNLRPDMFDAENSEEIVRSSISWPTPFYRDRSHPWPFSEIDFRFIPEWSESNGLWPRSPLRAALPIQRFINWAWMWLAKKTKNFTRDLHLMDDRADPKIKEAWAASTDDLIVSVKKGSNESWDQLVKTLSVPEPRASFFQVIQMANYEFERISGVSELIARGDSSNQMRSAAEANVKREMTQIRPEDMSNANEDWQALIARKEAIAMRYHMQGRDVARIFGEPFEMSANEEELPNFGYYTKLWQEIVATNDIDTIVGEFDYRIESGSMRKPNVAQMTQSIDESAQVVAPILTQAWQATGDPTQINKWLSEWAQSRGYDADAFELPPFPVAPPMSPGTQGATQ